MSEFRESDQEEFIQKDIGDAESLSSLVDILAAMGTIEADDGTRYLTKDIYKSVSMIRDLIFDGWDKNQDEINKRIEGLSMKERLKDKVIELAEDLKRRREEKGG